MKVPKGMVQVMGTTYRIARLMPELYEAVRITDDMLVGLFHAGPKLEIIARATDEQIMTQIAQAAIRQAKAD